MAAGIVLAGGRSSRMGTPKAWLDWHGATPLRRTCESVRNLNGREDYDAALAEPEPAVHVRTFGPLRRPPAEVRAATLGAAAAAVGITLDSHVLAALNGDHIARDPLEPLVEGDDVAFMAADAGG